MNAEQDLRNGIDEAVRNLEQVADEVKLKIHLASMDARTEWREELEPRLFSAREHARQATSSSKAAIDEVLEALNRFAKVL